ncbi:hypothetical protein VTL71DRAFT_157 [Oculimacula yallundae]|uniref:Uncharacterized protein n=1 Tax=Oculimacula yallundae TaxID=86028 RepID=A0ABR4CZB8_9HELO
MTITSHELESHCTKASCWIAIHGEVYDVTGEWKPPNENVVYFKEAMLIFKAFLNVHPGGAAVILKSAGKDATEDYDSIHNRELVKETLPRDSFLGPVDPVTVSRSARESRNEEVVKVTSEYPSLTSILNLDDFEQVAKKYLSPAGWAYYTSGADDEYSKQEAGQSFRELKFRPRVLRNVESIDTHTLILGKPSSLPVYISSSGLGKYAHPNAELTLATGAGKEGLIQLIPTSPSMSLEAIYGARTSGSQFQFQQLYVNRDFKQACAFIQRVEKLGATALWITVDSPVLGKRERDERLKAEMIEPQFGKLDSVGVAKTMSSGLLNSSFSWVDLDGIREVTKLPLVLKGIQSVEDAVLAYQAGVAGIVLSNHGGRSLDTAQAPIITLLEIRKYAPFILHSQMQIFLDGGIRRGTDVVKAIALGATAVGLGRSSLYSMTAGYGEAGIRHMVQILRTEIETCMSMLGARNLAELVPDMINTRRLERDISDLPKL